jgi:NAD(P)H-flavin reductase/hemoglobin-like flavoprotein
VARALDGGGPDYGADGVAGQPRLGIFKRQRSSAVPPAAAPSAAVPAATAPEAATADGPAPDGAAPGAAAPGATEHTAQARTPAAPDGASPAAPAPAAPPPAPAAATAAPAAARGSLAQASLPRGRPAARPRGGAHRAPGRRSGSRGPAGWASAPAGADGPARPVTPATAPTATPVIITGPDGESRPPDPGPRATATRPGPSISALAAARIAATESMSRAEPAGASPAGPADFDARVVKETFACLAANAPLAMEHFYSHLFISSPETRAMFPMEMGQMRERLFAALSRLVHILDRPAESAAYLAQLGRDHRKYGVKDKHFEAFFAALLETTALFAGADWSPETETAWRGALEYAARTMRSAAAADARDHPAWWVGEIVDHDRRTESVAVLTIRTDKPLPYRAGQYVPVQVPRWPRVWRPYSIANAPRADGLIHLHVRAVPGGMVSPDLVRHSTVGDTVLLGPASGEMTAPPPGSDGDLRCIAGGTGLAPIKAIVETAVGSRRGDRPRRITLFVGARRLAEVYDLSDLAAMQSAYPGLQVILVLSDELPRAGSPVLPAAGLAAVAGPLPEAVLEHGPPDVTRTYVCGPAAMVARTVEVLTDQVPAGHLHYDPPPAGPPPAAWGSEPASAGEPDDFRRSPLFAKFAGPGFAPEQAARL